MIVLGNLLFRIRNGFFPALWVLLMVALEPRPMFGDATWDLAADLAGFAIIVAGLALRIAVIGLVNIPREGRKKRVHAARLATTGLFRQVRNPLYVGNLILFTGWLIMWNNPWAYLVGLPLGVFFYQAIIRAEEAFMEEQFGEEFRRYKQFSNRWLPRLGGLWASLQDHSFNWGRAVAKEYNIVLIWTFMALTAMTVERVEGIGTLSPSFTLFGGLILGLVVGASTFIFVLKRQRILTGRGWSQQPRGTT